MFLNKRQVNLIKNAINDYKFIKEEIDFRISKGFNLEEISKVLNKFKGVNIESLENSDEECYLDFLYNDVITSVCYTSEKGCYMSSTFEIYDSNEECFIIEDFLTVDEYEDLINQPKEEMLSDAVATLKYFEKENSMINYDNQVDKIISFLKEEY